MKAICKFRNQFLYAVESDPDYDGIVDLICKDCYEIVTNEGTIKEKERVLFLMDIESGTSKTDFI